MHQLAPAKTLESFTITLILKLTYVGKKKFNASMHRKQLKLLQIQIWCVYLRILKFWMLEQELEQLGTS